jgi:hypothetical protein
MGVYLVMNKVVNVIVPFTVDEFNQLKERRINELDTFGGTSSWVSGIANRLLIEHTGYETGAIFCASRVHGNDAVLSVVGSDVCELFPVMVGTILAQFKIPDDRIISINSSDYLHVIFDDDASEYDIENWSNSFVLGFVKNKYNSTIYSIVPYLDMKDCVDYGVVDSNWDVISLYAEVPEINLSKLDVFGTDEGDKMAHDLTSPYPTVDVKKELDNETDYPARMNLWDV